MDTIKEIVELSKRNQELEQKVKELEINKAVSLATTEHFSTSIFKKDIETLMEEYIWRVNKNRLYENININTSMYKVDECIYKKEELGKVVRVDMPQPVKEFILKYSIMLNIEIPTRPNATPSYTKEQAEEKYKKLKNK